MIVSLVVYLGGKQQFVYGSGSWPLLTTEVLKKVTVFPLNVVVPVLEHCQTHEMLPKRLLMDPELRTSLKRLNFEVTADIQSSVAAILKMSKKLFAVMILVMTVMFDVCVVRRRMLRK
jgi:hypothetical protein